MNRSTTASFARPARAASSASRPLAGAAALAFGALAIALYTQHALDMQPCSWCVAQRLAIGVAGALAGLGALLAARGARSPAAGLAGLLALATAAAGLGAAVWQQGWASKSLSCAFTLADKLMMRTGLAEALPAVFQATAPCAEANQALLGVPYALWSAAAFVLIAAAAGVGAARALRR